MENKDGKPEEPKEVKASEKKSEKVEKKIEVEQPKVVVKTEKRFSQEASVLIAPHISEKAARVQAEKIYVFLVKPSANKNQISKAVQAMYGVKPIDVRTVRVEGKRVGFGRIKGQRSDIKKAYVKVSPKETIAVFESV